jgi:hypothetical protein
LQPEHLLRLGEIIDAKNWRGLDRYYHPKKSIEELLVALIKGMSDVEVDLTLDLIDNYLLIPEYGSLVWRLLDKLEFAGVTRAIVCPIKLLKHVATKSGQNLLYDVGVAVGQYPGLNYQIRDDPLGQHYLTSDRTRVVVDDFVGTGEQFLEMVAEIQQADPAVRVEHLAVLAIQEEAQSLIQASGVSVHALYVRPKAIVSLAASTGRLSNDLYSVYDAIESRVPAKADCVRGYRGSEALVTLKRTPDNTLPIFWERAGGSWPAPFPR